MMCRHVLAGGAGHLTAHSWHLWYRLGILKWVCCNAGMCRREVLDNYLRKRAQENGAKVLNGLFMGMEQKDGEEGAYTLNFNNYEAGGKVGKPETLEVDLVVGADGANSRVAREIDAGEYDYAIAFQVRGFDGSDAPQRLITSAFLVLGMHEQGRVETDVCTKQAGCQYFWDKHFDLKASRTKPPQSGFERMGKGTKIEDILYHWKGQWSPGLQHVCFTQLNLHSNAEACQCHTNAEQLGFDHCMSSDDIH